MKKFLFTLAAALMASTMFAEPVVVPAEGAAGRMYMYFNDVNLTENKGGTVVLDLMCHFEDYMSAFQLDLGTAVQNGDSYDFTLNTLPGGLTVKTVAKGAYWNVPYITDSGDEDEVSVSVQRGQNNTRIIGAQMESSYWDPDGDGEYELQGVAKWAPTESAVFLKFTFNVPADYAGGLVCCYLAPTCGADNNPEVNVASKTDKNYTVANFSVDQEIVTPDAPTITFSGEETTTMTVTVTAADGCTLIVNGVAQDNPYTYTVDRADVYTAGTVEVTAKAVLNGVESAEATASKDFVVQEQPVAEKPAIEFVETKNDDNEVVEVEVVVTNATDYTVYVDGVELRGEKIQATTEAAKAIHVDAENDPGYPYVKNTNSADYTLNKLMETTEKPVISSSNDDATQQTTITATGNGHICLYNDDVLVAEGDGVATWTVPYSDDPEGEEYGMSATAQEEGKKVSEPAVATIEVPGKTVTPPTPTQKTQTPDGAYAVTPGQHEVVVTLTPANDNQTIMYRVIYTDANGNVTTSDWMEYTDAFNETVDGHYRIEFYATEEGYLDSEVGVVEFYVTPTTGIDEIANGKTVAGVRYFNMAGQEMQEANGMTIVVTTYTDGTTSAVKVMK